MRPLHPPATRRRPELLPAERLLGPAKGRYFGAGYRDVRYTLDRTDAVPATAAVAYPEQWSVDGNGVARTPHLSSVDAVVLILMLLEAQSTDQSRSHLRHTYVNALDLRAGSTPWLRLDAVPLTLATADTSTGMQIRGRVGNIRVGIDLATAGSTSQEAGESSVYGSLFRTTASETFLGAEAIGLTLNGVHQMQYSAAPAQPSGVEADWWPGVTMIDYLVTLGQLTQGLVYRAGGVTRERAGALWMRTMQLARSLPPASQCAEFTSVAKIMRDRLLQRQGTRVHDVEVLAETSTGVSARSTVAYSETAR